MRYGSGSYTEWEDDRQASKNDASLGLDGWYGNKTIEHEAQRLAEQRGDYDADTSKTGDYWGMAKAGLLKAGRQGKDIHSGRFAQENEDDMNYMRERIDSLEDKDSPDEPEEKETSTSDIKHTLKNSTTDSDRLASAKERSTTYKNIYETSYDDNDEALPEEDTSEKAAASFMADYSLNLKDKMKNGTFNA